MQKVYTKKLLIIFSALCFYGISLEAQTCTTPGADCSSVTQNFNSGNGNFVAFPATFVYNPGSGDGEFTVASTAANTSYVLNSYAYTISTNGRVVVGYDF